MNLMENQQAPQSAEGDAKVITLCGSTKFEAEFAEVNQRLTMEAEGHLASEITRDMAILGAL
jgi:hypothetical protein